MNPGDHSDEKINSKASIRNFSTKIMSKNNDFNWLRQMGNIIENAIM